MSDAGPGIEISGRDLVRRAVLFEGPARIPRSLPDPWGSDFLWVGAGADPNWSPSYPGEDEFGCGWEKDAAGRTMGQVKVHPLLDYAAMAGHRWPDYANPARYVDAAGRIAANARIDAPKFALAGIPFQLIHRLEYLRGHEAGWTDAFDHPDELEQLLTRLTDIALDSLEQFARIGVDGIISADDWGLQDRPMVSPAVFRRHFQPHYARLYGRARELGVLSFLHSCGHITDLLDGLVEAGVQVIQMDQQENMGVEALARRFGGRVCFWCPVDIQQTMVRGNEDDVRAYARGLIDAFGAYDGGFIAAWYGSPQAVGHTEANIAAMCDEFVRYGARPPRRAGAAV